MNYSREEYLALFPHDGTANSLRRTALEQALDNRRFEIELYWKRATYFWAFIAAAFAAYFILQKDDNYALTYMVACLGFVFSLGWYFVNRGSKAWQQNWEQHVDLLETEITGPLHKLVIGPREYKLRHLSDAYPFSVSKINQLLSFFVATVWLVLVIQSIVIAIRCSNPPYWMVIVMTCLTGAAIALLRRATTFRSESPVEIKERLRTYVK